VTLNTYLAALETYLLLKKLI